MSLRDDVIDRIDIVDLVSRYVDIKKAGKNRIGLCPFHKEKSPSFTVAEDKQIFKCFGCGKGGSAITFHMEIERIDFRDSLQILAKETNVDISVYQKDPEKEAASKSEKEKQKLMNKRAQQFFVQNFEDSAAQEYAKEKRGLSHETIETFGLGYAPDSYYDQIGFLKDKGFTSQDIVGAGLAKQKDGGDVYAFFRHRLTFPIYDHIGNVVGFGARALGADQSPKYLNTTETAVYNKSKILFGLDKAKVHLKSYDALIIVEGYMDVIALHQHGLPIGIATCGTALTVQHTKLIRRHTEHLIFAFDNDTAGFEATIRGLKVAYEQDLYPKVLMFPGEYKDVDDWLSASGEQTASQGSPGVPNPLPLRGSSPLSGGNETSAMEERSAKLQELTIDGFGRVLDQLEVRYDLSDPVQRKKMVNEMFGLLSKIEDYSILQLYFTQLAKKIAVSEEQLWKQFRQWIKKSSVRSKVYRDEDEETRPESSSKIQEKYLLGCLAYKSFATKLGMDEEVFGRYEKVLSKLAKYFPTTVLGEVYSGTLSPDTTEKLTEAEMFWEVQVADLDTTKVTTVVQKFLHGQIYKLQRVVMKSQKLTGEQKQVLLGEIRGL